MEKLNMVNLMVKVMEDILEYQIILPSVQRKIKARDLQKVTKPLLHRKS